MPGLRSLLSALAFIALSASPSFASDDAAALAQASERGALIYALDRAAWVGTDEMMEQIPDPRTAGIGGWIVVRRGEALRVIFFQADPERNAAVFTADVEAGKVVSSHRMQPDEDASLSPEETRMVQARRIALAQPLSTCTRGLNTVVLPPAADGSVLVYVMSPQVKMGEYPLGGHRMFEINDQGEVTASRDFTNSCLNVAFARTPAGASAATMLVTHLLDATPTEIHVFTSLTAGLPVAVVTPLSPEDAEAGQRVWIVDGGKISLGPPLPAPTP